MSNPSCEFDPNDDKIREECGVFGIFGIENAASLTALGLHALQHRGQEACGIAATDGQSFRTERHLGLVGDNFTGNDPSYAFVGMTENMLIGARDRFGIRPLLIGRIGDSYVLASETCAFDMIDAEFIREVDPGEVVVINEDGIRSFTAFPNAKSRPCIFEFVYFARPDSIVGGKSVYQVRKRMGERLAQETPADVDVIIPVPDSGVPAKLKHSANRSMIEGKKVLLVDDSIVRGTTSTKIVRMIKAAGAKEVHFRSASPPIKFPDHYGIDMPSKDKLIAANYSLEEMTSMLEVDSLGFLSVEGLYWAMGEAYREEEAPQYTDHCFTGAYPTALIDRDRKLLGRNQLSFLVEVA